MKNKGFTLIELLGVMVILSLLLVIVLPNVVNSIKSSGSNTDQLTMDLIYNATELYMSNNSNEYQQLYGNTYCISLAELSSFDYLKRPIKINQEDVTDTKSVKVSYTNKYSYELIDNNSCNGFEVYLNSGMTPVMYVAEEWVVADTNKLWYSYQTQEWANAVILNSGVVKNVGDIVTEDEMKAMFVWIPRYEYKYTNLGMNFAGGVAMQPGEISVNFISKQKTSNEDYKIHPAFTFGGVELSGFWVGKFETTVESNNPTILPNKSAVIGNNISNAFNISKIFENYVSGDSHMMKNIEWGAVAYLSHSKYGKYGNTIYTGTNKEIYQNKSKITGNSNGIPGGATINTQCVYNDITNRGNGTGACGAGASTTGNITGIYDMSGGTWEYVMGVYANSSNSLWSGASEFLNSGYTGLLGSSATSYNGVPFPNLKYYDVFKESSGTTININNACSGGICYGHALGETSIWYGDLSVFITNENPWLARGGSHDNNTTAVGIFNSIANNGSASEEYRFRVTLTK